MIFIGVDPGVSGSAVAIDEHGQYVSHVSGDATLTDQAWWLEQMPNVGLALIERVHSMPKQGVASSFKFGRSYGQWRGILAGAKVRWEEITPTKWQTAMECRTGGDKNVTKARAQQLYPDAKVTHRTADALLLAELGRRLAVERGLVNTGINGKDDA